MVAIGCCVGWWLARGAWGVSGNVAGRSWKRWASWHNRALGGLVSSSGCWWLYECAVNGSQPSAVSVASQFRTKDVEGTQLCCGRRVPVVLCRRSFSSGDISEFVGPSGGCSRCIEFPGLPAMSSNNQKISTTERVIKSKPQNPYPPWKIFWLPIPLSSSCSFGWWPSSSSSSSSTIRLWLVVSLRQAKASQTVFLDFDYSQMGLIE